MKAPAMEADRHFNKFVWRYIVFPVSIFLLFVVLPCPSGADDSEYRIIKVSIEDTVKKDSASPVKDFYVNAGSDDGISRGMLLDVYRYKKITDNFTGDDFSVPVHVGQLKVFKLYSNLAVTRVYTLTTSGEAPVLEYRNVMIGDSVVPYLKKNIIEDDDPDSQRPLINKDDLSDSLLFPSSVLFGLNKSKLKPEALKVLAGIKDIYRHHKDRDIVIQGHTCSIGSDDYNMELSRKRAQAVADYLKNSSDITDGRIHVEYFGEKSPIASNMTEQGRRINRRVVIRFISDYSKDRLM